MQGLSIIISTSNHRIFNLKIPDEIINVYYVVVHQIYDREYEGELLEFMGGRKDISYVKLNYAGLSASRNFGLLKSKTKYAYIMDDDVDFNIDTIKKLVEIMDYKNIDIATCKFKLEDGSWPKKYSDIEFNHNIFTSSKVSSIEICVNVESVRNYKVLFDENFGLGSKYPSGEEYVFLTDCIKKKMSVSYIPVVTGIHPVIRSGDDFFSSKEKIIAKRKMIKRIFDRYGFIFIIAFWLKKFGHVFKEGDIVLFTRYILFGR
ncbi:glycosyltransferase [Marinobacterium mangrovicola]|uniref:Glycosyl transferase family 2 n=1 Tax=Marinobacterium mangrovicola TaxID=1476959 RepID=A0A4R1GJ21_9GAMM|nr:glycosyltransferase [Marinobacterium mangrovicola]TCK07130.1 glycosyl transferase family 2 [Marinobacterium mangrovicola]